MALYPVWHLTSPQPSLYLSQPLISTTIKGKANVFFHLAGHGWRSLGITTALQTTEIPRVNGHFQRWALWHYLLLKSLCSPNSISPQIFPYPELADVFFKFTDKVPGHTATLFQNRPFYSQIKRT